MAAGGLMRGRGHILALFSGCEKSCEKLRTLVEGRRGESAMTALQQSVLRDLEIMRDLPLRALSERLKKFPFVDPAAFDELLTEMVEVIIEWVAWVTHPDWIVEVLHRIGKFGKQARDTKEGDFDLEEIGKFTYPMPLKLRELQAMIRPFMEVRSAQRIVGVDAVMSEVVRALLRLFHTVKSWDDALMSQISQIAKVSLEAQRTESEVVMSVAQLCSLIEMDPFDTVHRLNRVRSDFFMVTPGEIEVICQKLPYFLDQGKQKGLPTLMLDHVAAQAAQFYKKDELGRAQQAGESDEEEEQHDTPSTAILQARAEALSWWNEQEFMNSVPTRILASTILNQLVDQALHPDPYVAEMLPRVLEKLFSEYMSAQTFMNALLPQLGGYVDARGMEVGAAQGLPLKTDPERCAETLIVFLRRWSDLVLAAEEEDWQKASESLANSGGGHKIKELDFAAFVAAVEAAGHSVREVVGMLEGAIEIPPDVINVAHEDRRYKVEDTMRRTWEVLSQRFYDLTEIVEDSSRDLGPYVRVDIDRPETVAAAWGGSQPATAWCLTNPEIARVARMHLQEQRDGPLGGNEELPATLAQGLPHASDSLSLTLVEWPDELAWKNSNSTFVKFFAQEGRHISRSGLQGLPQLPWTFGRDKRNTIVVDVPGMAVASFHCILTACRAQPWRPCIIPTGNLMTPTYLVCPKYQPVEVHNGDRLICQQWTFELRIVGSEHVSTLTLLTDEGEQFEVPMEGCHVGAGNRSKQIDHQPAFPPTKFPLKSKLKDVAAVQFALVRNAALDRWMLVDHSPEAYGSLMFLRPGVAYPLSVGMRIKMGSLVLEVDKPDGS